MRFFLPSLYRRIDTLERKVAQMATVADLRNIEATLKQAVADVATRVSAKLAALEAEITAATPDLTSDVQSIQDDVNTLALIAADAPTPNPPAGG